MARQFRPVRFFVLIALAAFLVCGVTAFYTHRAAHGRTSEERAAYAIGEKAGEEAPMGAKLPTAAELEHDGPAVFQAAGIGGRAELGPGVRKRLHGWIHEDASSAVNRCMAFVRRLTQVRSVRLRVEVL